MTARPLVTTIVTFYNQGRFVRDTLESVLAQDYPRHEVIAVDDGSTDDTPQACAAFGDRILYHRQRNAGVSAARNAGTRLASGDLLAFMDGDDLWLPAKIATQVAGALRHPESGIVVSDGVRFDESHVLSQTLYYGLVRQRFGDTAEPSLTLDVHEPLIDLDLIQTPSQILIPAAVFGRVGPWDERIRISSDYEMFLRIAAFGYPFTFLRHRAVRYRVLTTSLSGPGALREFVWGLEFYLVFRAHARFIGARQRPRLRRRLTRLTGELARDAYHRGRHHDLRWARSYLVQLAIRSRRPHLVVPYLTAAWVPEGLAYEIGRLLHRVGRARRTGLGR
jgi:glycosyltransferase involved in cell wall biosynthesis